MGKKGRGSSSATPSLLDEAIMFTTFESAPSAPSSPRNRRSQSRRHSSNKSPALASVPGLAPSETIVVSPREGRTSGTSSAPVTTGNPKPKAEPASRPKRAQVARACDWCRVHRSKCDAQQPCSRCKARGGICVMGGSVLTTLAPHVYREVESLRARVRELEAELRQEREMSSHSGSELLPADAQGETVLGQVCTDRVDQANYSEGIHLNTHGNLQKIWFGPSSLFYIASRIDSFLTTIFPDLTLEEGGILPNSTSMLIEGRTDLLALAHIDVPPTDPGCMEPLSPAQEEFFLNHFWQSYYANSPILDEQQFQEHYRSLWLHSDTERQQSPLAEIVIAHGIQYGIATLPSSDSRSESGSPQATANDRDWAVQSWRYYQRCQALIKEESERPTLATLQCHLLCAAYLCYESLQNMADGARTLAVRTAYMLGLHLEPSESLPAEERELRKRLWWAVYVLETKMSMKLGRPFLLSESGITCSLPATDRKFAMLSGIGLAPMGRNVTWLSWFVEVIRLHITVRNIYTAFYDRAPRAMKLDNGRLSAGDTQALEAHAAFLNRNMKKLDQWAANVPEALKVAREGNGTAFSADMTTMRLVDFVSPWIQRQRLLLELIYHNTYVNLCRPFIVFSAKEQSTPLADETAASSARHAMALTLILHQALSATSIFTGWHEAFQWQWNAAVTLVGYALAFPQADIAPNVRNAIHVSITVFEIFGQSFKIANNAAIIMRDLRLKIDMRTQQAQLSVLQMNENHFSHIGGSESRSSHQFTDFDLPRFVGKDFLDMESTWDDIDSNDLLGDFGEMEPVFLQNYDFNFSSDMYSQPSTQSPSEASAISTTKMVDF